MVIPEKTTQSWEGGLGVFLGDCVDIIGAISSEDGVGFEQSELGVGLGVVYRGGGL